MTGGTEGVVHFDVTRIALIEALANVPLTRDLNLEARGRMADALLGQMPEASPGVVTEERCREIMQATVAEGMRPVIDAELAKSEAVIRAAERERCAAAIRKHAGELRQLVSGDPVTAAHLDGLVVAAAFLRDGMEGDPQP